MKKLKKSITSAGAIVAALLGLGATGVLADEQPPIGEQPAEKPGEQPPAPTAMAIPGTTLAEGMRATNRSVARRFIMFSFRRKPSRLSTPRVSPLRRGGHGS